MKIDTFYMKFKIFVKIITFSKKCEVLNFLVFVNGFPA